MRKQLLKIIGVLVGMLFYSICQAGGDLVQITGLQDFDFGEVIPPVVANLSQTDRVCIYSNDEEEYEVTATGLHDRNSKFNLQAGNDTIEYRVYWGEPGGRMKRLKPGQDKEFEGASQKLLCAGVPLRKWARLRILIRKNALNNPIPGPGVYSDTLTLFIEPE